MRAWRVSKHGDLSDPSALALIPDHPKPEPGRLQVRVRVRAFALNHLDLWVRKGVPGHRFPLPLTTGCDFSGEIDAFGEGSAEWLQGRAPLAVGSRVMIDPGVACGTCAECTSPDPFQPLCPSYGIFGETCDGGAAEFAVVPVANLIPMPEWLTFEQAAAYPLSHLTAYTMLSQRKGRLREGDWILIHSAGSGVSIAAIQMAKHVFKAGKIITTVGSPEKTDRALALGADQVIVRGRDADFSSDVRKLCKSAGLRGLPVVIDHLGAETFHQSLRCLSAGGRLITCGATTGGEATLDLKLLFFKNLSVVGSTMGARSDLRRLVDLIGRREIPPPIIDSVFPFEGYRDAQARMESRAAFGKIVVRGFS